MRCLRTTIAMMAMASPGMTKSLSKEVGGRNIRVNLVCPGLIATPMTQRMNQAGSPAPPPQPYDWLADSD